MCKTEIVTLLLINYVYQGLIGRLLHTCPSNARTLYTLVVLHEPSVDTISPSYIAENSIGLASMTPNRSRRTFA